MIAQSVSFIWPDVLTKWTSRIYFATHYNLPKPPLAANTIWTPKTCLKCIWAKCRGITVYQQWKGNISRSWLKSCKAMIRLGEVLILIFSKHWSRIQDFINSAFFAALNINQKFASTSLTPHTSRQPHFCTTSLYWLLRHAPFSGLSDALVRYHFSTFRAQLRSHRLTRESTRKCSFEVRIELFQNMFVVLLLWSFWRLLITCYFWNGSFNHFVSRIQKQWTWFYQFLSTVDVQPFLTEKSLRWRALVNYSVLVSHLELSEWVLFFQFLYDFFLCCAGNLLKIELARACVGFRSGKH